MHLRRDPTPRASEPALGAELTDEGPSDPAAPPHDRAGLDWSTVAVGVCVLATLWGWWPATDRLDLPKVAILGIGTALGVLGTVVRGRHDADPWIAGLASLVLVGWAWLPAEMGARIEGIASWIAAIGLGWWVARVRPGPMVATVAVGGIGVAVVAIGQGLGLDLLGGTRIVSGTLGGPGHLGWTLAATLPFVVAGRARSFGTVLVVAALVLSGSRTGWGMAVVALPLWVRRRDWPGLVLGIGLGLGIDRVTLRADVPDRIVDLASDTGTARGRIVLWRMAAASPSTWLGAGGGPEAFQRRFPAVQGAFLEDHPDLEGFRSDLRHAHVDIVEVGYDYGILGILLLIGVGIRGARRGPAPARGALVAIAVGGLASPVLFFAPTLAVAAIAVGLGGPTAGRVRWGAVPLVLALGLVQARIGTRLVSEVHRSGATALRLARSPDRAAVDEALRIDDRNVRAHLERALTCRDLGDRRCTGAALRAAARDLPIVVAPAAER